MSALRNRLRSLEIHMIPSKSPARVYMLAGVGTDAEIAEFLHSEGWKYDTDADMAIVMRPVAVDYRDDHNHGPKACDDPALTRLRLIRPANPEWRRAA